MGHARGMCYVAAAYHFGQGVRESRFDALRWCVCIYPGVQANTCKFNLAVCRYQRSAALGDSLAKKKIGEFGLLDVPALIKSRAMHSVKNFARRRDNSQLLC